MLFVAMKFRLPPKKIPLLGCSRQRTAPAMEEMRGFVQRSDAAAKPA